MNSAAPCAAIEFVTFHRDDTDVHVSGKIVVEAKDGGILLQDRQGKLWTAQPDEIVKRSSDTVPYVPMDRKELSTSLLAELPKGFETHATAHYVICYNTSPAYAQWCGALFERLYRAFANFWTRRGLEVQAPEMPLVAMVFADSESYQRYASQEIGAAAESISGYYNLMTNRIVMYDLTGAQATGRARRRSSAEINRVLSRPDAGKLVATIIHEATHQIAFNCGVQTRLADIPIWLNEGMAMYFETPDLNSSSGWRGIGSINRNRLFQFRSYARSRPADSLLALLSDDRRIQGKSEDERFQGRQAILSAYSEAWCLTYYLIKHKPKQFVAYLKFLGEKQPSFIDTPEERIEQFEQFFGDLKLLDRQFIRQVGKLR